MSSLVSIIITSYNYAQFLAETINSAINQTYSNIEVIVVDDGSTDGSREVISYYEGKVIPILKQNEGQGSSFNAGFAASKGDIILFLDSDDTLLSSATEKVVKSFDSPDVAKVHWLLFKIDAKSNRLKGLLPDAILVEGDVSKDLISLGPDKNGGPPFSPPTSGNAWSRRFLEKVLPMPEADYISCPDHYLFVLTPLFGKIKSISEPLGCYRVHDNNYSLRPLEEYIEENLLRFEKSRATLAQYLSKLNISYDETLWTRNSWYHKLSSSIKDIKTIIPVDSSFILIDGNDWGTGKTLAGRKRILFIEKDGQYWGFPSDDEAAISELVRQHQKGVSFIVFSWTGFWLLDYYKKMRNYLKASYKCLLENDRLIIYRFYDI